MMTKKLCREIEQVLFYVLIGSHCIQCLFSSPTIIIILVIIRPQIKEIKSNNTQTNYLANRTIMLFYTIIN